MEIWRRLTGADVGLHLERVFQILQRFCEYSGNLVLEGRQGLERKSQGNQLFALNSFEEITESHRRLGRVVRTGARRKPSVLEPDSNSKRLYIEARGIIKEDTRTSVDQQPDPLKILLRGSNEMLCCISCSAPP
ncbi:hypothetical protein GOODEAATRI_031833 [Goodea atripinnis]|uniref:Uncharacterized protein n=1 Tax=Goodea atripinnis TaxID=208336 RepID=A0ABV0PTA9_9TELE